MRKSLQLDPKKRYLQIALNSTLEEASAIINQLPISDRIIIEAGTPLIKRYGQEGIRKLKQWYQFHLGSLDVSNVSSSLMISLFNINLTPKKPAGVGGGLLAYVVADLKTMDRGATEVNMAAGGGADAAIALGSAPIETLNEFVENCESLGLDSMIDMMNVNYPLSVLRSLKKMPTVVILHRGVDEEKFNKEKQLPLHEIRRIKGNYDIMISVAGGDTIREVQKVVFNDADIVVVWKSFYQSASDTRLLAEEFLKTIK